MSDSSYKQQTIIHVITCVRSHLLAATSNYPYVIYNFVPSAKQASHRQKQPLFTLSRLLFVVIEIPTRMYTAISLADNLTLVESIPFHLM